MKEINMPDGGSPDIPKMNEPGAAFQKESLSTEDSELITSMINEEAGLIARYSVGPTIQVDTETGHIVGLEGGNEQDELISRLLAQVPLDDENLTKLYVPDTNSSEVTDDQFAHMAAIAAGKARALEEASAAPPKEKEGLNDWRKKTGDFAGKIISKIGGKKGVALAGSATLALVGTACSMTGSVEPSKPSPTFTPEGIGASVTMVNPTATKEATATETQTPTPEIDYSKVDIFNVSSWPEKEQTFWDGGWLFSKEDVRQEFQTFMEKSRAAFFEKEGISDEVAKMTEIRPELRSLWGMVYWAENNKDEVIKNKISIPVTPKELEWMMTDPIFASEAFWPEVHAWNGEIVTNEQVPYARYIVISGYKRNNFSSDVFGMPIAGRDGLVVVPRAPLDRIIGDLAALGYVGGEENRVNLLLMNLFDENGLNHLAAPAVSLDGNMIALKGSPCPEEGGGDPVIFLTEDYNIDQLQDYRGKKYTAEELLKLLGRNMIINFMADVPHDLSASVLEPKSKNDIATRLQGVFPGEPNNWPWVKSPTPTTTSTPK